MKTITLFTLLVCLMCSGCVSSRYKLSPKSTPPPVALNLTSVQPPLESTVNTVIVYQGPGSWKREAYWDEYVVTLVNRGTTPVTIDTAALTDFQGSINFSADDPWKLEALSKTWWQKVKSSQGGNLLALGAGAVGLSGVLLGAAIGASGGFLAPATAASNALAVGAAGVLVAAPIYAVTVVVINSNNKKQVLAEFNRRRLVLPVTIPPGEMAQGSLFFRLSPSPQQFQFHGRSDQEALDVSMDLSPLRSLHLKAPPQASSAAPSGN